MTESEVFDAVTNGGSSDFMDLMRILEAYPETRALMPEQIKAQVPE